MAQTLSPQDVNTSAYVFEELATSLASLTAYMQADGKLERPVNDLGLLYREASEDAPSYKGVNELTGQSLTTVDRRAGRGAWLLANVENLQVYGVHTLLWHAVKKRSKPRYLAPVLDQLAAALGTPSRLADDDLQRLGKETWVIDVLGLHNGDIWLVQTLSTRAAGDGRQQAGGSTTATSGSSRRSRRRTWWTRRCRGAARPRPCSRTGPACSTTRC